MWLIVSSAIASASAPTASGKTTKAEARALPVSVLHPAQPTYRFIQPHATAIPYSPPTVASSLTAYLFPATLCQFHHSNFRFVSFYQCLLITQNKPAYELADRL